MAFVFKHEAVLAFVGRLVRDREFAEWFVARPTQALASHGLTDHDIREVAEVVRSERHEPHLARALQPTVAMLLACIEEATPSEDSLVFHDRYDRLDAELRATHDRLALARQAVRPWWKFW